MSNTNRRIFMLAVAAASCAIAAPSAYAQTKVDEADEQAAALGYKHDSKKVDKAKYPKHDVAQVCSNCSFWQGAATDAWAGCAMFGRKQIAAPGWCQAWTKKPG
jgi:hypothetical protein